MSFYLQWFFWHLVPQPQVRLIHTWGIFWLYFLSIHQQTGPLPDASTFPSCSLDAGLAVSGLGGGAASGTTSSLGLTFLCGEKPVAQHHGWPGLLSDYENGKEPACECRRHKTRNFDPWVGKIPWRRTWLPTPLFLPGESHGQRSLTGYIRGVTKSQTRLKRLSTRTHKQMTKERIRGTDAGRGGRLQVKGKVLWF